MWLSSTTRLNARATGGLRALGVAVSTLWLLGACCNPLDPSCVIDDDDDDAGPPVEEVVAFANCDVDTIRDDDNGETCATCPADAGDALICGVPETARCESRENSRGERCSICITQFGEVLYDSCFRGEQPIDVNCEVTEPDAPQPDPGKEPGGPLPPEEQLVCETCTDFDGNVVSSKCEPVSDNCEVGPNASGLTCRVCTRDGEVVVNDCEQPDVTPRSCEAYGNEVGRCVDCFDENDDLLTHFCTLTEDVFITCADTISPDGVRCTSCFDQTGAFVEYFCDEVDPTLQQCALLDYSEQTCVVCLDFEGFLAFSECERKGCDPAVDETCLPPPDCSFEINELGEQCRTCPTDAGDVFEQQCVVETNLFCEQIFAENTQTFCTSCKDIGSGQEVFRRCEGEVGPPPCFTTENQLGEPCEVCVDPNDPNGGEVVYASCPSQTCYELGDYELYNPTTGNTLRIDSQPAVAKCDECGATNVDGTTQSFQALCTLRSDVCGPVDLTDPSVSCDGTVTYKLHPQVCENPWQAAGFESDFAASYEELTFIMSFALETAGVGLVAAAHSGANTPVGECAAGDCTCARGDVLDLVVLPNDAGAVVEMFGSVIQACVTDTDCAGQTCRQDGGCG